MKHLTELLNEAVGDANPTFGFDDVALRANSRHRRRRGGTAIAVVAVVCLGVVVGALSFGHKASEPAVNVSPTTTNPTYRASETLVVIDLGRSAPTTEPVHLIPNAPLEPPPEVEMLVGVTKDGDFATTVARAGGLARFTVAESATSPLVIDVVTTSSNRGDANRTLAIVDSLLRQKFADIQAGTRRDALSTLATLARHNA